MRYIFLLLLALGSTSLYAQYPNSVNKMRLGTQTTGDGLIYRHSGVPNWTPTGLVNSWQSIDTTTGNLWAYRSGEWRLEVAGDLQQVYPKVINKSGVNIKRGEVVGVDTSQIIQGDLIRIMRAIGDGGLQSNLIMGVAATDINDNAQGYVVWFGYVREVVEANIAQTGDTLNVGDILYLSSTQPGRYTKTEPTPPALKSTIALVVRKPSVNNMTLLVRPNLNEDLRDLSDVDLNGINNGQTIVWDSINTKWIAGNVGGVIDTTVISTKWYVDSKVDSTRLTQDSILVYYLGGVEVGRDTIAGVGGGGVITGDIIQAYNNGPNSAILTNQIPAPEAIIIVDNNNSSVWDGLAVVGIVVSGIPLGVTLQGNDNITISTSSNIINFGLQSIEAKNPTDAANKGVPTGTYYRTSADNTMGLPKGTLIEN
jgi:hypothetical protein